MNTSQPGSSSTLVKLILTTILFGVTIYFFTIVFVTGDLLWFVKGFNERPARIVVYHNGQSEEWHPGEPGYDLLSEAIRQSLDRGVVRQTGIGMGDTTLQDAYKKYVTVEAFFGKPVKLHSHFYTGHPDQMLFPITGRHSELTVVYLGDSGQYRVNPPELKTVQPIRDALLQLGISIDE
jgi:hypothetical protein